MKRIELSEREKDYLRELIWRDTNRFTHAAIMLTNIELMELYYKLGGSRHMDKVKVKCTKCNGKGYLEVEVEEGDKHE